MKRKFTDDYEAKYEIWARERRVIAQPRPANLPRFKPQKFSSYEEFNRWKRELIEQVIRSGGFQWKK